MEDVGTKCLQAIWAVDRTGDLCTGFQGILCHSTFNGDTMPGLWAFQGVSSAASRPYSGRILLSSAIFYGCTISAVHDILRPPIAKSWQESGDGGVYLSIGCLYTRLHRPYGMGRWLRVVCGSGERDDLSNSRSGKESIWMIRQRDFWIYLLLSIVTCGIYGIYFWYKYTEDVNTVCYGDGQETMN